MKTKTIMFLCLCILNKIFFTERIPFSVLFGGITEDRGYRNMGDFHEVPFNRSYLHLKGHFKRDEFTCIRMAEKLKELCIIHYSTRIKTTNAVIISAITTNKPIKSLLLVFIDFQIIIVFIF